MTTIEITGLLIRAALSFLAIAGAAIFIAGVVTTALFAGWRPDGDDDEP